MVHYSPPGDGRGACAERALSDLSFRVITMELDVIGKCYIIPTL